MGDPWDRRIRRAEQLATDNGPAASLLAFYVRLLRSQKRLYESFHQHRPSGALARDLELIRAAAAILLGDVAEHGPPQLAVEARSLLRGDSSTDEALLNYWRAPSDRQFFAKAILQPYAQWLCDEGLTPLDRAWTRVYNRCPKCGGMPQLSILEAGGAGAGDGSLALTGVENVTPVAGFAVGVVAVVPCRYRACPGGRIHRPGPSPRGHRHSIA